MSVLRFSTALLAALFAAAFAGETLTVRLVAGDVQVRKASGMSALKVGDKVGEGEQVITAASAFAALKADDGSVYKLAADTTFDVRTLQSSPTSRAQKFSIPKGKVLASISRLSKQSDISFSTPSAVAGVRGTVLVLDVKPTGTVLYVLRGLVAFSRGEGGGAPQNVGADQKATAKEGGSGVEVKAMTPADQKDAASGIPVKVTVDLGNGAPSGGESKNSDLKDELRANTAQQQQSASQNRGRDQQRKEWDVENGRTVRVGGDLFTVSQRFRRVDDNNVRILQVMDNTTQNRVTVFEAKSFWEKGIPNISGLLGGSVDTSSSMPTRSDVAIGVVEKQVTGDFIEWTLTKNGSSTDNAYRINGGGWYTGDRVGQVNEGGKNYLVLMNASGAYDYKFERYNKVVNAATGEDTKISASGFDAANAVGFLTGLGETSVYAAWVIDRSGSGKASSFNSTRFEVIVTAEYLTKVLVNMLTQI